MGRVTRRENQMMQEEFVRANQPNTQDYIDLADVFRAIWKHIRLIILLGILCGGIAFVITRYVMTPQYSSSSTIYLTPEVDESGSLDYNSTMANSLLVNNVVSLLTQNNIMSEVAQECGLENADAARQYITVENKTDTELVTVTATTPNPKLSKKMASSTISNFIELMKDNVNVRNIEIVDKAKLSYEPSGPNVVRNTEIGALIGLLIGMAYAVIRAVTDTRLKSKEEAEKYLGIPVLCELPDLEKK